MTNITIKATSNTPWADFDKNGLLKLEGRSFPAIASDYYDPLIEFAAGLNTPCVSFDINLEYINTASSKKLLFLLNALDENKNIGSVQVNWFYEEGDDDSIETAEIFEDSLKRIRFTYNEVAEVSS
jgi:hypothetical protein